MKKRSGCIRNLSLTLLAAVTLAGCSASGTSGGASEPQSSKSEDAETIEDMYEPYLLQIGLIKRTPRGRIATAEAYRHLNIEQDYE